MTVIEETFFTPHAIKGMLGVHINTVRKWIKSGQLKAFRADGVGSHFHIRESDLEEFIERRYHQRESTAA